METAVTTDWNRVSEVELIYKSRIKASERPQLTQTRDAYAFLLANWDHGKIELLESCKAVLMNKAMRVLGLLDMSSGGVTGTVVDPRILFAAALKANANTLIIAHNHPSGNLRPSEADRNITDKIKRGAEILDFKLVDHIILTTEGYFSFADEGLL